MTCAGISLGMKCDSAIYGVENGLRKRKEEGYNTCPFDEMISNYPGLIECIKDDFKYFCDPLYLTLLTVTMENNTYEQIIYNTKYRFAFNHESPGHSDLYIEQKWPEGKYHFVNNNYAHFIARYTRRIESFRYYLTQPFNHVTFILQRYNTCLNDLKELTGALDARYPRASFNYCILFLHNESARGALRMLKFAEDEEEMERLNWWNG